uniref:C2H2-type domain-containing protein n=2 Tax=Salarias fasciatus TaxID=181472 RepID=A0A672HTI7_SALFA
MRKKHNLLPAVESIAPQQVKQSLPIITPISVCQQALLQLEPNGPLQKVDANIDTEQIRKMIESMGNIQKVNQVVILGQVPPHAPPLEVQQIPQVIKPVSLDLGPTHIDFTGLKQTESNPSNSQCPLMEQTIILEPITPDGQLENPSFSELGSQLAAGENIELTLVHAEQTVGTEGEVIHQILEQPEINVIHSDPMDTMICQSEADALSQDLEQTVILELTPALMPTEELENSQNVPQNEITSSSLLPTSEFETPGQTVDDSTLIEEPGLSVPPLLSTVELELTSLQPEQHDVSVSSLASPESHTNIQSESDSNPKAEADSLMQTVDQEPSHPVMDSSTMQKTEEKNEQEQFEKLPVEVKNTAPPAESSPATEQVEDGLQKKHVLRISVPPVNVMSAQELVKVRKRKPAQAFVLQGYVQDLFGSVSRDDLHSDAKPAKRQRTKKSHLVVKFGPQNKEKKTMKQKKISKQCEPVQENVTRGKTPKMNQSEKKVPSPKKGKKGKKDKAESALSPAKMQSASSNQVSQPVKEDTKKSSKMKKQKEAAKAVIAHKTVNSPMFKKKKQPKIRQKDQPKTTKGGKTKKNLSAKEKAEKAESPGSHIKQDSLLLLKGHKQPQLKVYKLDPSKTSSQPSEVPPQDSQTRSNVKDKKANHLRSEPTSEVKKKERRPSKSQKVLKLLPSLQPSPKPAATLPAKPKTTRKRKASSKVEAEGVITSQRALQCKDCGERFSEVSSLQKHKTMVHVVESPRLTYTNGNIFEGVSTLDIYQLPKDHAGVMNAPTDWDTEPEMSVEDRERNVSFPALIPSPSLPIPPADVEMSAYEDMLGTKSRTNNQPHTSPEGPSPSDQMKNNEEQINFTSECSVTDLTPTKASETAAVQPSDKDKLEEPSPKSPRIEPDVHSNKEEDIKEDFVLEVDLVTVGEQNDKDSTAPQNQSSRSCDSESPEQVNDETSQTTLTLQTVSCSTHPVEVKEEEEELLVQKRKDDGNRPVKKNATRGRRRTMGCVKRDMKSKSLSGEDTVRETESEKEQDDCNVIYEEYLVTPDSEVTNRKIGAEICLQESSSQSDDSKAAAPPVSSTLEESREEQLVFELESVTTSVQGVDDRELQGQEPGRETDQSPGIILEKFLTSGQREAAGCQEIKVETEGAEPLHQNSESAAVPSPHHRNTRSVLVKEESYLMLSDPQATQSSNRMRWNVEPVSDENAIVPFMDVGETPRDCRVSPEFSSNQCIFYPVKEEEREVLLGATQTDSGSVTTEGSSDALQVEHQTGDTYERSFSSRPYQETEVGRLISEKGVNNFTNRQEPAWQRPPDLRDFLLQSSDEEHTGSFELSDHQLDSEAEIMAYFSKDQTDGPELTGQTSGSEPASSDLVQAQRDENRTRVPIDYFCTYFNWDTWVEFTNCTNKLNNLPNPVTCREVACFVGIHIAMGTLKFPSPRLYWEDLTKVPLIAETMPLSRFLELTRMLKLTSPSKGPANPNLQEAAQDGDFHNTQLDASSSSHSATGDGQSRDEQTSNAVQSTSPTDPLWRVQPILRRFMAGCRSLRQPGEYAVDQYSLPLTGRMSSNKPSLHCTTLIGFSGLLSHVDLKLDLSDKEDAVEKMVSKGSMVFLCKQELSTPAMLERLLAAGVHGAGRVGGARGQIGDEFVSSDGKLMLRRSHCGFILSTAGNGQRNMASLTDNFEKAQMSARLNRDLQNLYKTPLTASTPTCWPHAVLWYLTDLALVNSWLTYRRDYKAVSAPLTLMAFRLEVSKALILSSGSDTQDSAPPQPPEEKACSTSEAPHPIVVDESPLPDAATRYDGSGHWPEQLGEGEGGRCRFGNCQRTSRVLCLKCCVFLCISRNHNCFLNFHNQESSDKE